MDMKHNIKSKLNTNRHPEAVAEGSHEILHYVQNDIISQRGRSMVEMLGVLAIIGVLSVAGIAGYKTAMTRHRANELLNEAAKRAVVVAAQFLNKDTASLSEFAGQTVAGGNFKNDPITKDANNQFTLTIENVDIPVCEQMQKSLPPSVQKFEPENCEFSAKVELTFNADLSQSGTTLSNNDDDNTEEGFWVPNERCESDTNCQSGETCLKWDGDSEPGYCSQVGQCSGSGVLVEDDGPSGENICYSCNSPFGIYGVTEENCNCENRTMIKDSYGNNVCVLKNCPSGTEKDQDGNCIANCSDYPDTDMYNEGGSVPENPFCRCPYGGVWDTSGKNCEIVCPSGFIKDDGGKCILDPEAPESSGYVIDINGDSVPCSNTNGAQIEVQSTSNCESVCSNRILIVRGELNQYFCIKKCAKGFILNRYGECVSCDASSGSDITIYRNFNGSYCETQCSNRKSVGLNVNYEYCRLK